MESAHAIFYGTLYSLSEQQLVSCSSAYGNNGCGGGWYYWAWNYAAVTPVTTETVYPYTSGTFGITKTCTYQTGTGVLYDSTQTDVAGNTSAMNTAAYQQVLSVAIEADTRPFQLYQSGVYSDPKCGTNLDHGVLNVGYGTMSGQDYWIVKNSWSSSWGQGGYIYMARNTGTSGGQCGILMQASQPSL